MALRAARVLRAPLVELREYKLHPHLAAKWCSQVNSAMLLRQEGYPLRTFTLPESGGTLNVGTHSYYYEGGHDERDAARRAQSARPEWKAFLAEADPCVAEASSALYAEAKLVANFGLHGMAPAAEPTSGANSDCATSAVYELRRYQLQLGYDTVPRFLELFAAGLPSKLAAPESDPTTSLVTILHTEVGALNEVIELWRHGSGTAAMGRSREAARAAVPWRAAIADIAGLAVSFRATIHRPLELSPWK